MKIKYVNYYMVTENDSFKGFLKAKNRVSAKKKVKKLGLVFKVDKGVFRCWMSV